MIKRILLAFSFFAFSFPALSDVEPAVRLIQEQRPCAPEPCVAPPAKNAIVLVHGLTGSQATWKADNGTYLPDLIVKDADLKDYDVWRIDYDSFKFASSPDADTLADLFFKQLSTLRGYDSITFIGHSLGGLIIQRFLQDVNSLNSHIQLNKFRLVILLGTPSKGSLLANYADWLTDNPQVRILKDYSANDYLKLLGRTMWYTMQKHEASGCASLRIFSAYEGRDTNHVRVVSKESATSRAFACREFDTDHVQMSKPTSNADENYTAIKKLLVSCLAQDRRVCPPPSNDPHCGQLQNPIENGPELHCDHGSW
ncbi:MAG: alpha/beta hydrolase [Hyphomicrobium sp.]